MYKVLKKQKIAENTYHLEIASKEIAQKSKAGQFCMVVPEENGERIPLTIADTTKNSVILVILALGPSSQKLTSLRKGDTIPDFIGPLGKPSEIDKFGNVAIIGGGCGIAPIYPIAKAMKEAGNKVVVILGAKSKKHLFWEDKFDKIADKMYIATDDGSKGTKGFLTKPLEQSLRKDRLNRAVCVGPPIMMQSVSKLTKHRVKTIVSLNPIMVDGIGMCGSCRVTVDKETKFACVDGPEFDAHLVDFDNLIHRNARYDTPKNHKRCH